MLKLLKDKAHRQNYRPVPIWNFEQKLDNYFCENFAKRIKIKFYLCGTNFKQKLSHDT